MDHSICTETATFLIGDCDALDKEQNKYELAMEKQDSKSYDYFQYNKYIIVAPDNPHLQKDLPDIPDALNEKFENSNLNLNRKFFMIKVDGDICIPIFLFVFNKKIDSFFYPIILDDSPGLINNSTEKWNEENIALKKLILNQFSEEKSKWVKIGQLNIPSGKLAFQEDAHSINPDDCVIKQSKKKFDIFAVYSVKKDLYKIYLDPDPAGHGYGTDQQYYEDLKDLYFITDWRKQLPDDAHMLYGLFFKSRDRD